MSGRIATVEYKIRTPLDVYDGISRLVDGNKKLGKGPQSINAFYNEAVAKEVKRQNRKQLV